MSTINPDIFDDAADLIERYGWDQGFSRNGTAVCIDEALGAAGGKSSFVCVLAPVVKAHVGLGEFDALWVWNDAPERTEQEVLDALRGTAKAVRRQQEGLDL